MRIWIDTTGGSWGEDRFCNVADIEDEKLEEFDNMSDNERISLAIGDTEESWFKVVRKNYTD
jgi:hypothetical protein